MRYTSALITFLTFLVASQGFGQVNRYFAYFTDKPVSDELLANPQGYLSQRAIERREKQGIDILEEDLPVNGEYVDSLTALGTDVWYRSRWFNGAYFLASDSLSQVVNGLGFVDSVVFLSPNGPSQVERIAGEAFQGSQKIKRCGILLEDPLYGPSTWQMEMLGADEMHRQGFKGEGLLIAVVDAGFKDADQLDFFDHLYQDGRIVATYDFSDREENVYDDAEHGTNVLSVMAAYQEGSLIGSAYEASYCLFKSENTSNEYREEEFNWLMAAERADSMGVDIINTSLGYYNFDDSSQDYEKEELDGKTAIISKAASIASQKGMLIVNAAGNEGNSSWKALLFPADVETVLAVGAVGSDGDKASFSSPGPTADGRFKPDVAAPGASLYVGKSNGNIIKGSGTSFASPILAGLAAGIWQAYPDMTSLQLLDVMKQAGSQVSTPDSELGYGIPTFQRAQEVVTGVPSPVLSQADLDFRIFPNPTTESQVYVVPCDELVGKVKAIEVLTVSGGFVRKQNMLGESDAILLDLGGIGKGVFLIRLMSEEGTFVNVLVRT